MYQDDFIPLSPIMKRSGTDTFFRDLILLGILNGLVVALSHLIHFVYSFTGIPLIQFFHQSFENLLIATVYMLMILKAPRLWPLTINGTIWGVWALMMGYWPTLPVAVPAGMIADFIIRKAGGFKNMGVILVSFALYTTMLDFANYWPILFLKQSALVGRIAAMDPLFARIVEAGTLPLFMSQLTAAFITGLVGGGVALKIIKKHFVRAGIV